MMVIAGLAFTVSNAQKIEWACKVASTNDPNTGDYGPNAALFVPDAYPSGIKENGNTYYFGLTYEQVLKKVPTIKLKLEYCTPIIAEQVVIVETLRPGVITKVTIEDVNGKSKVIYNGKAAPTAEESRLFHIPFTRTTAPIKYVSIEADPYAVANYNCIDAVGLCADKGPVDIKINLGSDLHFISKAKSLNTKVNSSYTEVVPVISANGKVLYFDRKDHPHNTPSSANYGDHNDDIYKTVRDGNGDWQEAVNVGKPLNNGGHNFVNSITPDGNTMLIANTYNADGSIKGKGASITRRLSRSSWSLPEELTIEDFNNKNDYVSFFLANNNKVLLMAIEDEDSHGQKDVYVSFLQENNTWTKPKNIGADVNTAQDEYFPVLASDNKTMYFSSNGHYGYGMHDIFVTRRLDDSWTKWSKPINLGPEINDINDNMGFSIPASGKEVYSYSWKDDVQKSDIFVTDLNQAKSVQPQPVFLVSGHVYNAKTKKPIHADISYELLPGGQNSGHAISDPDNGEYKIVLPVGEHYGYYAIEPGYIAVHENIDIPSASNYTEYHKDLYLIPIEAGQKLTMNNIFFEQSKPVLLASSYPELDRIVEIMKLTPKLEFEIDGHTDNQGDALKNLQLSQQRVDVVKDYLVKRGIKANRITTKAFGGTKPIAANDKEETRKLNRRVEFIIIKH